MTLLIKKPTGAKLVLSKIQQYPAVLGEPWGGGYFAGYISHTADGSPTHALIVAPRATGATGSGYTLTTNLQWKTADTTTAGTTSPFDGAVNTAAMVTAGIADHPAANFCVGLSIGGFTDWYLPSRYELDIAYFNLKPGTGANVTTSGTNIYAVPQRNSNWTANYPTQTTVSAFKTSTEAFATNEHRSSTEHTASLAWAVQFLNGDMYNAYGNGAFTKVTARSVRAFRRIAL
jgi:hypothetical protein